MIAFNITLSLLHDFRVLILAFKDDQDILKCIVWLRREEFVVRAFS